MPLNKHYRTFEIFSRNGFSLINIVIFLPAGKLFPSSNETFVSKKLREKESSPSSQMYFQFHVL